MLADEDIWVVVFRAGGWGYLGEDIWVAIFLLAGEDTWVTVLGWRVRIFTWQV